MAFVRAEIEAKAVSTALVIANADGSQERLVKSLHTPTYFLSLSTGGAGLRPAWSPDDASIALIRVDVSGSRRTNDVVVLDVKSGTEHIVPVDGELETIGWLSRDALLVVRRNEFGAPWQLWRVLYPSGKRSRMTNDLNNYTTVDLSADRTSMVTAQSERRVGIWAGDATAAQGAEVIPPTRAGVVVAWTKDRLLYVSETSGTRAVTSFDPVSRASEEIISKARTPRTSLDGRTIVFTSTEAGSDGWLWKAGADGSHPMRLLAEPAVNPHVALDDRQVVFISNRTGLQSLWMMPLEGGSPAQLSTTFARTFDVSPDGASVAFTSLDDQRHVFLMLCDLPKCVPHRVPTAANFADPIVFMPGGHAIAHADIPGNTNLWAQPLDGGAPRQLTHFTDGRQIGGFAWSHDGKRLAISRQIIANDIMLFKGLRP